MPHSNKNSTKLDLPAVSALTFEEALAELETLTECLEGGKIGLKELVETYQRGANLVEHCQKELEGAQRKITSLSEKT
jgi:exodeoxyribonuclease VII small subunit